MQAVILAGGLGTRLAEETYLKPKPMVEIGGKPILWHILKTYGCHGINRFVICCGYKGYLIKEYFTNYFLHTSDIEVDLCSDQVNIIRKNAEPWNIKLVDTGEKTMTGGRLKKVSEYLDDTFCFTYGDGLSNIDIAKLIRFHENSNTQATITAVKPPGRFGALSIRNDKVAEFKEKPDGDGSWINGGYFVLNKSVIDLIDGENCIWEHEPLNQLAISGQLSVYKHFDFWQPMDTMRDKQRLNELWESNEAPWKIWSD